MSALQLHQLVFQESCEEFGVELRVSAVTANTPYAQGAPSR